MKLSESELIKEFSKFLIKESLINKDNCHFSGDDEKHADVELEFHGIDAWKGMFETKLYIEAKSHHSTDSQNSINKIFGQLLKETGKRDLDKNKECLAILFPAESGSWTGSNNKKSTNIDGVGYYRRGFSRIKNDAFVKFGEIVNAKYILSFSSTKQELEIFLWSTFHNDNAQVAPCLTIAST
ncbi:MAG: hypothetical protein QNK20_07290 [Aureibaculum sp.]|nr:hypothetical protein [Aureibaculum sp.]